MPKQDIIVGDVWLRGDSEYFVVTREYDKALSEKYGELYYCQNIGSIGGVWFSRGYLNSYMKKVPIVSQLQGFTL